MAKNVVETPLMKQYFEMKKKHPDAVLLFRVGDFYETFSEDAIEASEILGITLTRRANGAASSVELAGFPHHALDTYLPKLVRAGKRVAICEQLEDPKLTKKLVKRGITELVTPGVATGDNILHNRENNFLAAIHMARGGQWGVAFLDLSTGEFLAAEGAAAEMEKLLSSMNPKEVLVEHGHKPDLEMMASQRYLVFDLDDWVFNESTARERLHKQFEIASLKGFGVNDMRLAIIAAGAILHYLDVTHHTGIRHIAALQRIDESHYVRLDPFTVRNLELIRSMSEDGKSLLEVIDRTVSPMGARMLARWIRFPLRDHEAINRRLDVVEHFFRNPTLRDSLVEHLSHIGDLQRLMGKAASGRINPREMTTLRAALEEVEPLRQLLLQSGAPQLKKMGERLDSCESLRRRIANEIAPDAPVDVKNGGAIKTGFSAELDEYRRLAYSSKQVLNDIQRREIAATGISSLKIGYNKVFGYYLEVTNTHRDKVPAEWIRKQTLTGAERYITFELKELEEKINNAQAAILLLEPRLYAELVEATTAYLPTMATDAELLAQLDCLLSHSRVALENHYCRPVVDTSLRIEITEGRHPVIERELPIGEPYITNSVSLSNDTQQIMMLTGPNMSGKSALLRQTALNVLLAQTGSFVAAESAHIGVVDKIFTRVGASDNISHGESTFMVEMNEAASILNNMSERSLILFDELGRGTSTYDGISIAWAIVEYIHNHAQMRPKTLFATHYHELNEMERQYERVVNYNVSVREIDGKVVFLRKLARGGSEHSFGIHVAKLAGMPASIVGRANEVLHHLEQINRSGDPAAPTIAATPPPAVEGGMQLSFFQLDDPVLSQIRDELLHIEIDNLTPLAALNKLHDIKKILTGH